MRRPAVLLGSALFAIAFASGQAQQTNQAYLNKIVNARFIMVTTESGDPFDPKIISDDRRAAGDIQNKINEWKRFTLVYRKEDADIVIAVRAAGRFARTRESTSKIVVRIATAFRPALTILLSRPQLPLDQSSPPMPVPKTTSSLSTTQPTILPRPSSGAKSRRMD
jgi:hypothetical protein